MTKIEKAIYDTKLRLDKVKEELLLLSKEKDVLIKQLDMLELINADFIEYNESKKDSK